MLFLDVLNRDLKRVCYFIINDNTFKESMLFHDVLNRDLKRICYFIYIVISFDSVPSMGDEVLNLKLP
jgi:hypothetical protein